MNQLISKTLSEIVNDQFQAAAVFEKYHLDYCCKGKRSLQQACVEENIIVENVVSDLQNIFSDDTGGVDFKKFKLQELSEHIIHTHHSYVKKEMPQIISYLEKVASKHGKAHTELYKVAELFGEISNEMSAHMDKEETVVFPRIKELEQNSIGLTALVVKTPGYLILPIIDMENEHEDAGNKMNEIRLLTNNYTPPADSCTTFKLLYASLQAFEIDLHKHVNLENSILFPKALLLEKEIQMTATN
jgi:regulator of cell morphogenesis and NO signaling